VEKCLKQGRQFTASADIHDFFGSIDRNRLMTTVSRTIWEQPVLDLLETYLHMGATRHLNWVESDCGIAQGSPLSPLLSNVYLLEFDLLLHSTPDEHAALIGRMVRALGDTAIVSVHCHDDLGLATANSLAAVQAGARQVECTINGIGERAGNCALEEIVMAIKTRQDRLPYQVAIQTEGLFPASQMLSELITFGPQPNKAIVGCNAFAHEAGIHQDGVLKERTTYEIMDPKSVGVPESRLVLGKHSGRHALRNRCEFLGFDLSKDELDQVYQGFIALADCKKGVLDIEITDLVGRVATFNAKAALE
jgi:2-isopropylmalate synthase